MGAAAVPTLVGRRWPFPPHAIAVRAALSPVAGSRCPRYALELDAQIRRARAPACRQPLGRSSARARAARSRARRGGACRAARHRAVRYPAERFARYMLRSLDAASAGGGAVARGLLCAVSPLRDLRRSDDFVGFYFGGRLDEANLATVLDAWHRRDHRWSSCAIPGERTCGRRHWGYAWAAELRRSRARASAICAARGLQLISYRDVSSRAMDEAEFDKFADEYRDPARGEHQALGRAARVLRRVQSRRHRGELERERAVARAASRFRRRRRLLGAVFRAPLAGGARHVPRRIAKSLERRRRAAWGGG